MNIHHRPQFDTERVCALYSEKDGVPVTYVCTSAINSGTHAIDIFYRETPHPQFGNRYFGLYYNSFSGNTQIMITNADAIEDVGFEMVKVDDQWHYSQHRHDFHSVGDVAIDGGRAYIRLVGNVHVPRASMKVVNGKFVQHEEVAA
jgi:alpha-galactosidase